MNSGDRQRLSHIRTYCQDIAGFIERFGKNYETFINDRAYFSAVSMCVLQIGELANGLSEEFREQTKAQMPWGMIRGMRNWLAHAYAEIDETVIWETSANDIPKLAVFCDEVIAREDKKAALLSAEKPSILQQLSDAKEGIDQQRRTPAPKGKTEPER